MMSLLYAISFLCFLRIDEALKLEVRHFRLVDKKKGKIEITLDFRKTAQDGGKRISDYNDYKILIPVY